MARDYGKKGVTMKKKYGNVLVLIGCFCAVYCASEEFIKPKSAPKSKKSVSEQQCIELDGDLIVGGTQLSGALIDLSKAVFTITQAAVTRVNDYACGEKGGLGKGERAALYAKKIKIKEKVEACIDRIQAMTASLTELTNSLSQ
jgi:hypothetical protein